MTATLALAGDTMLGRGVAEAIAHRGAGPLWSPGVRSVLAEADLVILNLECCVSARGEPLDIPGKPFFFRAPPQAARALAELGVDAVTLANNHALDYGPDALTDTLGHLAAAGITAVGAGQDAERARAPAVLAAGGLRIGLLGATDHPAEFAAGPGRPGVAYAPLGDTVPGWLADALGALRTDTDLVVLGVHWGPNMVPRPVGRVRRAAPALLAAGASLIMGHSAHVPHGFTREVLYDLGDFVDDYAVHPELRNDLGVLLLVTLDADGPRRTEAVPVALEYARTRLAAPEEYHWVARTLTRACAELGTDLRDRGTRLVAEWV